MGGQRSHALNQGSTLPPRQGVGTPTLIRGWIGFAATRSLERVLLWHDRATQRRHLEEMSDHMLKDIGLTRADVDAECRKPFWQP